MATFSLLSHEIEEIENHLSEIDKKYNNNNSEKPISQDLVTKLVKEFDTLGIVEDVETEEDVINKSSLTLINMYRKQLLQQQEANMIVAKLKLENFNLKKKMESLQGELDKCTSLFEKFRRKTLIEQVDIRVIGNLRNEIQTLKNVMLNKENLWSHKLKRLSSQNDTLQEQLRKNVGSGKSRDTVTAEVISTYKKNEEKYKSIILKMHNNNILLMGALFNIRHNDNFASMKIKSLE
ncbi:hypothetical protein RI129_010912 [Pyrocoelia pectoralis]|uniref:Uncharacterized protein n=1 Tax=Pyrocoelia pectoralis TaxID=417401 RepID=A0AAN7ZGW0_9COLE